MGQPKYPTTGTIEMHDVCIHELFESQVARTPEAVAVVFAAERVSYRELNERANQLAHYLRRLGVGPEVQVGILLERSVQMLVALLAVLKAGGAYVPLDPRYPAERLAFMIGDADVKVLLTQAGWQERLGSSAVSRVIEIEEEKWGGEGTENLQAEVGSGNLAYVIYTSGSTGRPKGVAIAHQSAVTLLHWARETYAAEELHGVLAATSICFDLSVFEIFAPLSWGGQVILAENVLALPGLAARAEVRLLNTVPSVLGELVRLGELPAGVRVVNLAGEALRRSLVTQLYEQETIAGGKSVWAIGGHDLFDVGGAEARRGRASGDRAAAGEHGGVCSRRGGPGSAGRSGRGDVAGWGGVSAWVFAGAGADSGEVCAR